MKKTLLLFTFIIFTSLSFAACSSDEENTPPDEIENSVDPLIGTWNTFSEGGKEVSTCVKEGTMEFKKSGEFVIKVNKELVAGSNKCISLDPVNGTWKKVGDNKYALKSGPAKADVLIAEFSDNYKTLKTTLLGKTRVYKKK